MLGSKLGIDYASSDDDDAAPDHGAKGMPPAQRPVMDTWGKASTSWQQEQRRTGGPAARTSMTTPIAAAGAAHSTSAKANHAAKRGESTDTAARPVPQTGTASPRPAIGPASGPSEPAASAQAPDTDDDTPGAASSQRSQIYRLTLPPVPDFNIPPSPPGSPPAAATKKFANFLDLKKRGTHLNEKLAGSKVLRNPAHLQTLMDHAGFDHDDQYASALPEDLAVPAAFPSWAYVDELSKSQKEIRDARERENKSKRKLMGFVSSNPSRGVPAKRHKESPR